MSVTPDQAALRPAGGEREFAFTRRDFHQISTMLHADAGISLSDMKAPLVYSRLVRRLRALGLESFRQYCALIARREGADERRQMMAALTTNVTRFLREPHHFEHLKAKVLPPLLARARKGGRVRIWSAGCSTGEEPYSIALTILSLAPDAASLDIRILATDINALVVEQGRRGVYPAEALAPLSREMRAHWLASRRLADAGKLFRAGEDLRRMVAFREMNLMDPWPMKQAYDAIFCRNVVIYFEPQARAPIWNRMAGLLARDGCLYIGHSERLDGADSRLHPDGLTTYRLAAAPGSAS